MVDRLDDGVISPDLGPLDYKGLYKVIKRFLNANIFVNSVFADRHSFLQY